MQDGRGDDRRLPWQADRVSDRRNAAIVGGVALWVLVVLGLDTGATLTQQRLLGLLTWATLALALRGEARATRVQVAVVVADATVIEYVFADWLGV